MDVTVGPWRRLSTKELVFSNCGAGEDSWASFGQQEIKPVNLKGNQLWILIGRTDDEAEAPILWPPDAKSCRLIGKDPDAEERLRRGGEVGDKGWDDCMTSLIQPTGVWTNSRRYRLGSKVWHAAVHGVTKLRTGLSNWTTIIKKL